MKHSIARRLQTSATNGHTLPLLAIFFAVLGSRLWLIQSYGSDVPFWDQWDAEAALLYKPMLEHGYGAVDWFAAHNEHRIVLTRITSAVLLFVNGQWDPLLQVCWEALCAASIATLLCLSAIRLMPDDRALGLVFGLVLIGLTMPFGWENTLAGFQSQFYYLILIALAMFHLCAYRGLLTRQRSVVIGVLGVLSLGTVAAGSLACLAAACALAARLAFARQADTRRVAGLAAVLFALALIGVATTPTVAGHAVLHAQNTWQFLKVFNGILGWPTKLGGIVWLPFAAWCVQSVARRRIDAPGLFIVGLAAFVLLNAAAIATARGGGTAPFDIASRYTDIAWFAWLVNLLATLLLVGGSTVARRLVVMLVFLVAAVALGKGGLSGETGAAGRGSVYAAESRNTRAYVATGDAVALRDNVLQLPYPDADRLIRWLDDPTIRRLLPPGVRQGILARSGASLESLASQGLVLAGAPPGYPDAPAPDLGNYFGTWDKEGNGHTARFVSAPIEAQGPKVHAMVLGDLGRPGLSLYVEDVASGKRVDLVPDRRAAQRWTSAGANIPGPTYRLVAEDTATGEGGWFAFTDPVETGRLRGLVDFVIRIGRGMTVFGLALFLAGVLVGPLAQRRAGPWMADAKDTEART